MDFFLEFFWFFWYFLDFFDFFFDCFVFLIFCCCFFMFLFWIRFNVTKVTMKSYQVYYLTPKWPNMGQNIIKISFVFSRRAKKASAEAWSPRQELKVCPHSGPYLLVYDTLHKDLCCLLISIFTCPTFRSDWFFISKPTADLWMKCNFYH